MDKFAANYFLLKSKAFVIFNLICYVIAYLYYDY